MTMADPTDALAVERYTRTYSAGASLFRARDPSTELFLIRDGRVELLSREGGVQRTLAQFGPGELVGESALLPGAHRAATARAISPVTALVVDSETFRELARLRPEVAHQALRQLAGRLRRAEERLRNARLSDATTRVVHTLLHAAERSEGQPFDLSPLELSDRTGLDLDTLKAIVGQLRDRGYLVLDERSLRVREPETLRQLYHLLVVRDEVQHGGPVGPPTPPS